MPQNPAKNIVLFFRIYPRENVVYPHTELQSFLIFSLGATLFVEILLEGRELILLEDAALPPRLDADDGYPSHSTCLGEGDERRRIDGLPPEEVPFIAGQPEHQSATGTGNDDDGIQEI